MCGRLPQLPDGGEVREHGGLVRVPEDILVWNRLHPGYPHPAVCWYVQLFSLVQPFCLPFIVVSYLSIIIPSYYSILLFTFFTPCLLPLSFLSFSFQSFNFFSFLLSFVLLIFMFFFLQLLDLTEFNNFFIYLFVCLFIYDIIFPHSTLTV